MKCQMLWALIFMGLLNGFSFAQSQASLSGTVYFEDTTLSDVKVTLEGPNLIAHRTQITNEAGRFHFSHIPPGNEYRITLTRPGFQTKIEKLPAVAAGSWNQWELYMSLAGLDETLEVVEKSPQTRATLVQSMGEAELSRLPSTREMSSVLEMTPGSPDGISFFGGASVDNIFTLDGGEAGDTRFRKWDTPINTDAIDNIQVIAGGVSAEHRGGQGAFVNVTTKSGGNHYFGKLRFIKSKVAWNTKTNTGLERGMDEDRIALTLGGPLIKDRAWFFTSLETRGVERVGYYYPTLEDHIVSDPSNLVPHHYEEDGYYLMGKLNLKLSPNQDLELMLNSTPMSYPAFQDRHVARRDLAKYHQETQNCLAKWRYHGSRLLNLDLLVQYKDRPYELINAAPSSLEQPLQIVQPVGAGEYYPIHSASPTESREAEKTRLLKFSNEFQLNPGNLELLLKAGGEVSAKEKSIATLLATWVYWDHPSGNVTLAEYNDPYPWQSAKEQYGSLFLQSHARFRDRLQLNLGVRSESFKQETVDGTVISDAGFGELIALRANLAYELHRSKISASYTRNFGLTMNYAALSSTDHLFTRADRILNVTIPELAAMGQRPWENAEDWAAINPVDHPELWREDVNRRFDNPGLNVSGELEVPYTDTWSIDYKQVWNRGFTTTVHLLQREWYNSYENENLDMDWEITLQHLPGRWRTYRAAILTLEKQPTPLPLRLHFSYTRSETKGFSDWSIGSYWLDTQYRVHNFRNGRLGDYPNQFKLQTSYDFSWGLTVGLKSFWRNGKTYTANAWVEDLIPGSVYQGRWLQTNYEPQGSRQLKPYTRSDFHLAYTLPFKARLKAALTLDVFNLFNQERPLAAKNAIGWGHYDTTLEPGSDAWLDYVNTHAPVLEETYDHFGNVTWFSDPRSFLVNASLEF